MAQRPVQWPYKWTLEETLCKAKAAQRPHLSFPATNSCYCSSYWLWTVHSSNPFRHPESQVPVTFAGAEHTTPNEDIRQKAPMPRVKPRPTSLNGQKDRIIDLLKRSNAEKKHSCGYEEHTNKQHNHHKMSKPYVVLYQSFMWRLLLNKCSR